MYDLAVSDTMKLFVDCSKTNFKVVTSSRLANIHLYRTYFYKSLIFQVTEDPDLFPQYICTMCYRMCELWKGFRDRCQENERKLKKRARRVAGPVLKGPMNPDPVGIVKPERNNDAIFEDETAEDEEGNDVDISEREEFPDKSIAEHQLHFNWEDENPNEGELNTHGYS